MSFEIKKDESLNKTIRMPKSLIDKLEQIAASKNISFNKLIVQCCDYALENLKDESK